MIEERSIDVPPVITITAKKEKGVYKLSVKDNGMGISKVYYNQIFEIFKRLHTRDKYEGTGIGLASCRKIVEIYGGRIWVESVENEVSTFFFTIPV